MKRTKRFTAMLMVTIMLIVPMIALLTNVANAVQENVKVVIESDDDSKLKMFEPNELTYVYNNETSFVFQLKRGEEEMQFALGHTDVGNNEIKDYYYKENITSNENLYLTCTNFDSEKICVRYNGQPLAFTDGRTRSFDLEGNAANATYSLRIEGIYPNPDPEPGNPEPGNPQPRDFEVNFAPNSWTIGDDVVTATIEGKDLNNGAVTIQGNTDIELLNWNPQTMDVHISFVMEGNQEFSTRLGVREEGGHYYTRLDDAEAENIPNYISATFSIIPHEEHQNGDQPIDEATHLYNVDFGTARWEIKGKVVTATVEGKTLTNGAVDIAGAEKITLTGFDPKIMEPVIEIIGGDFSTKLRVDGNNQTSIINRVAENLRHDVPLRFYVQRRTNDAPEMPHLENANTSATFHVSCDEQYQGSYVDARLSINDFVIELVPPEGYGEGQVPATANVEVPYYYDAENGNGKVTLSFGTLFVFKYVGTITINGHTYNVSDYIDYSNRTNFLNHYKQQMTEFNIEVDKADEYTIVLNTAPLEGHYQWIGNFLWTDAEANKDKDDYVGNALLELQQVVYEIDLNGDGDYEDANEIVTVNVDENGNFEDPFIEYAPYGEDGSLVVPEGAECKMKITPDYGYQVLTFGSNDNPIVTGEVSEFTFVAHKGNFHLSAHVVAVDDIVNAKSDKVKAGTITIGKNEINSGTVVLSVDDAKLDNSKIAAFEEKAGDYTINSYLDIDLDKVVYKGTSEDVWSERIHELKDEATITLQLEEGVDGNNIIIVHNINDGDEYEIIEIDSYDPTTNTITFKTKSFSNYAIATKTSADSSGKEQYTVSSGDFTLVFSDEEGHTFELTVTELWNLTDEELAKLNISKEEYEAGKKEVINKIKKYGTILNLYDITVADDNFEHTGEVSIRIKMTEEMKKYNTFKLVCIDNETIGEKDVVDLKVDGDYLVGNLYHLSNYALVAKNESKGPATGDNILLFVGMFGVAAFGMIMTTKRKNKKTSKHA